MRTNELCANDVTLAVSPSHFGVLVFGSCFFDAGDGEQKMRSESSGRFSMPKAVTAQGALYSLPTTLGALESWLCSKSRTFVRSQCLLRGSGVDDNGRQFGKMNYYSWQLWGKHRSSLMNLLICPLHCNREFNSISLYNAEWFYMVSVCVCMCVCIYESKCRQRWTMIWSLM